MCECDLCCFCLMIRLPPRATRTDTLCPYTTLFRSDCEVRSGLQRKSINSLVRLSRAPCSWVVSSVGGGRDDSETFIESQPLTDADRRVISLDGRDEIAFRRLCKSVVSMRLIFSLPQDSRPVLNKNELSSFFDLQQRLGRWGVNDMMGQDRKRTRLN